jgi:hypothetical protein
MQLGLAIELSPENTTLSADHPCAWIYVNALHWRQIDHQTLVDRRPAGDVVTSAAYRYLEAERAGQSHSIDDVSDAMTASDGGRMLVDQSVVHSADVVVLVIGRPQQLASERWSSERNRFSE